MRDAKVLMKSVKWKYGRGRRKEEEDEKKR